ncbi:aminotransferase class I/II-fold pyridoxal phosphate-dependent enzyme [Oscillatoria sp. FACHB-1407]|uniref:aminotransferase class I/II-fold pyridoxal phosphate-dependent enzyme n=1 Tax=Oscillatoria sp. FACHB-1407 TaxID=2692847 RepID=UPI00168719EE|nr:aminotransferase class I/II-fold pyridoxal phosphate-dependent enzyme [Oscillatoria sp. FACHB-1407]MBD2463154.1 aminotransferase class I/II-fold pyridoxal phosphate-dependent enzyme [Oscillatoria sp. FACHB-1407]
MDFDIFQLERNQSLYENQVEYNLTESGVHPCTLRELLDDEAIAQLLDTPLGYGYTEGSPQLRQAVSQWYPGSSPDNILITHGSSEANLVAAWSLLSPGDELIFVIPNFMQLWGLARSLGVAVKTIALQEENGWQLDLDELRRLLTPQTKMIAFSNPNNPTGKVFSEAVMQELVAIAQENDIYLLADEIYRGAELNGNETPTFYGRYNKVIVVSGVAKSLAHPGLRIGWLVAPEPLINSAMQRQDYTTIGTGILNQRVAEAILQPAMRRKLLNRSHHILSQNLTILDAWVNQHSNALSYHPPQAGGMAFIRYSFAINSSDLSRQLREKQSVFVVAGDWFGLDRYIRVGIGSTPRYLTEALQRIDTLLHTLNQV